MKKYLAAFPEKTLEEKLRKAQLAASIRDYELTASLLNAMLLEKPFNVGLTVAALYSTYLKLGLDDKARVLLAKAIEHDPNEWKYKILAAKEKNATANELDKLLDDIMKQNDPYSHELELGRRDLWATQGNPDEALKHANAADQLQPDNNGGTWELRFNIYAGKRATK